MNLTHAIKNKQQIKQLLEVYPQNSKNRLLIEYAIRTGLRISDIINVKVEDVYQKESYSVTEKKTGKVKILAIHPSLRISIANYVSAHELSHSDYLFFSNKDKDNHIKRNQAHIIISKAGDMIGLTLSAHSLRKTFGYHAYNQGIDITLLQTIFQHSSQAVTLRYIDITQENINKVYNTIDLGF